MRSPAAGCGTIRLLPFRMWRRHHSRVRLSDFGTRLSYPALFEKRRFVDEAIMLASIFRDAGLWPEIAPQGGFFARARSLEAAVCASSWSR
jgi:hypothetical protein